METFSFLSKSARDSCARGSGRRLQTQQALVDDRSSKSILVTQFIQWAQFGIEFIRMHHESCIYTRFAQSTDHAAVTDAACV